MCLVKSRLQLGLQLTAFIMATGSNDFDFDAAELMDLSEVLDGTEGGEDLRQFDAKYAERLLFEEAIELSVKHLASRSYCAICFDTKERHQMFTISGCSHSFCCDCISKYVQTSLEQNITVIMCPEENCRVMLELEACRPLLGTEVINLWQDLQCEELLCATGGTLYCPFKDCSAPLLNDNQGQVIAEAECPSCHRMFCAGCLLSWHGISCEEYQNLDDDERGSEDLMVRNLAKENKWRTCPRCRFMVERTEGCPHITCWCQFEFCYECGLEWTPDHCGCQDT